MANYLFATVGGQDVQFKKESLEEIDKDLCGTDRSGTKKGTFSSPRETGQIILDKFVAYEDKLDYPIIGPVIDYLNEQHFTPDKIFLFVSNQEPLASSDTIFLGKILQNHFTDGKLACEVIELNEDPSSFDDQYNSINKKLSEIEKGLNPSEDSIFVFPQAGTPATRNALLLNCILYFPKLIQLGKPWGGGVAQQHFPQRFRDQVKIKSLPSTLKETLATISARNLSHTEGSHVMISFQKNLKEKLDALQSMASSTGFKNLKEKYDAFSDYLRGQMEYVADLSGRTASQTFFDYNFLSEVENLKEIIHFFLGNGLIDDLKQKNKTTEEPVKVNFIFETEETSMEKIVSIPGGSNGINAFYTIVKNFIRNLYKHSSYEVDHFGTPCYNIYIRLVESPMKDFYEVILYDGKRYSKKLINEIIVGTGYKKGIKDCIDDKLLDNNGSVRDYGWGILEMKIAACYLIGLPLMYFDEPANSKGEVDLSKKEVKKVFPKPLDVMNYENHLAYRFYLLKPETFLVIGNDIPSNETEFQKVGITFSKGNEPNTGIDTRAKFIIDTRNNHGSDTLKSNNVRQMHFSKEEISSLLKEDNRKKIISEWQQKMFLNNGQTFTDFTKIDLSSNGKIQVEKYKGNGNLIMIDSHGNGHQGMEFTTLKQQGYLYYSTSCSKDKYDIPMGKFKDLKWEQVEAIFTKVAILDERIQNKADEEQKYIQQLTRRDLLELRGVFVPKLVGEAPEAFNLRNFVFGNDVKQQHVTSLENIIKGFMSENHYVVLHFSILEKMAEIKKQELDTYYHNLATTKAPGHYLVLTSGKGTPSTLPEGAYFINFASLERAVKNLSKVELVQHLNALRAHHKSK